MANLPLHYVACGLFSFARRRALPRIAAVAVAVMFIASAGPSLIHAGFGAVFFGAAVGVATIIMLRLTDVPTRRNAIQLGVAGIIAGIIRPEGFLFAGVLGLTALAIVGRPLLRNAVVGGGVLMIGAGGFVLAHWLYFGFPLPNPYYKKGGGHLHIDGLENSVGFAMTVCAIPLLLLALIGLVTELNRRWLAYLGCVTLLLAMWILVSSEMNFNYRFQFPVLVVTLLLLVDLSSRQIARLTSRLDALPRLVKRSLPAMVAVLLVSHLVVGHLKLAPPDGNTRAQLTIANVLRTTDGRHLTVATTEAGVICWRSGWRCVDLWGLNNAQIAHHGYLDEQALAQLSPDVLVVHAPSSPTAPSISADSQAFLDGWTAMSGPAIRYAESGGYVLAAIIDPKPQSGFAVYVRPDESWSTAVIRAFEAVQPTIATFYGKAAGSHPALPTNG